MPPDDIDYQQLDPAIRNVVRLLRLNGFDTHDSGDGVSKADWIARGTAMAIPHVFVRATPESMVSCARDLLLLVRRVGVTVSSGYFRQESDRVLVESTYCPVADEATVVLLGLNDATLSAHSEPL